MRKLIIYLLPLLLGTFVVVNSPAQTITSSVRRSIASQISCEERISIQAKKIGPQKQGYFVECNYAGGGDAYVFENTRKLFSGQRGMNGSIALSKTAHGGYFDVIIEGHSAMGGAEEFYKWNGTRFVRYKCVETEIDNKGKVQSRPCSL